MNEEQHNIDFEERDDPREGMYPGLRQYRAICSCGWITPWYNYRSTAQSEAQGHA